MARRAARKGVSETVDADLFGVPPDDPTAQGADGHRNRMRRRLLVAGPAALADHEMLEMLLFLALPRRDTKPIARALLIDPPVLILDEATSALDAESEAIVNANLKRMAKGRTMISISHRLSMLVEADAILVLERGKVYDIGTHEELLRRCDIYKHMWYQQNRHADPGRSDEVALISHGSA